MNNTYTGFFDYASATPLSSAALEVMTPYFANSFYNPSAIYADNVKADLELARQKAASILGVKANEIIFTAGCTEANNIALQGVLRAHPGGTVLVSAIEHDSVLSVLDDHEGNVIPVHPSGLVSVEALETLIDDDVVMVSIVYANNEIGTVQNLREISKVLDSIRQKRGASGRPIYLHTDAAQAANTLNIKARTLGVQLMSVNGGKLYGPKGSGCLFVGSEVGISPLLFGGDQEFGIRSGTENIPSIMGFVRSLEDAVSNSRNEHLRLQKLQCIAVSAFEHLGGVVNGSLSSRLPSNISVRFDGIDNEELIMRLNQRGFKVASGSACHAASGDMSTVLSAIGLTNKQARETIRVSMGKYTDEQSVNGLIAAITQILA